MELPSRGKNTISIYIISSVIRQPKIRQWQSGLWLSDRLIDVRRTLDRESQGERNLANGVRLYELLGKGFSINYLTWGKIETTLLYIHNYKNGTHFATFLRVTNPLGNGGFSQRFMPALLKLWKINYGKLCWRRQMKLISLGCLRVISTLINPWTINGEAQAMSWGNALNLLDGLMIAGW